MESRNVRVMLNEQWAAGEALLQVDLLDGDGLEQRFKLPVMLQ